MSLILYARSEFPLYNFILVRFSGRIKFHRNLIREYLYTKVNT